MDLKLSYFCQKDYLKLSSFSEKRNLLPDPQPPAAGGFTSRPSKQPPPSLQIPGYQTRRHEGANRGRALPTNCLCPQTKIVPPPKRGLCPEEINRLVASGAQIEVQISVFWGLTPDFVTFLGWRPFFFILENTCFWPEKPLEILISAGKPLAISVKTFFFLFGDHLISAGKTAWISNFGRKIPLTFCSSPCLFDPDRDKFLVPPCPSRIHSK